MLAQVLLSSSESFPKEFRAWQVAGDLILPRHVRHCDDVTTSIILLIVRNSAHSNSSLTVHSYIDAPIRFPVALYLRSLCAGTTIEACHSSFYPQSSHRSCFRAAICRGSCTAERRWAGGPGYR
jgi:hypothetical protein